MYEPFKITSRVKPTVQGYRTYIVYFLFNFLLNPYGLFIQEYVFRPMEITNHKNLNTGLFVLQVSGDVDLYSAPLLYKAFYGIVDRGENLIHLDLSMVHYLDSSGVGTIIKTLQLAKAKNITLTFSGIQGTPKKVLAMSNILPLLKQIEKEPE